ncbi:MAG: ABC transporter ATP-binding protein [Phycisphaerae bacterium]|nr:ABC transporter ATP-binding protein [Phycisphaerae bacterium]
MKACMGFIELQSIWFGYDNTPVLQNLSVSIEANSFWAIVGPNGAGKTTFLRLLSGQLKPRQGAVGLDSRPLESWSPSQRAQKMSYVRQEFVPVFDFTVFETVLMARSFLRKWSLFETAHDREAAESALKQTDTYQLADRNLAQISAGERQRVFIARALAQQTPILLLDEPTSHLDMKHQIQIFDLLRRMQVEQGKTILMVTHDLNLACQYSDYVLLVGKDGCYATGKPNELLTAEIIEQFFSVKVHQGLVCAEKFFLPLGNYSKDKRKY